MKIVDKGEPPVWLKKLYDDSVRLHMTATNAYAQLSDEQLDELRNRLYEEQDGCCIYCMKDLDLSSERVEIEHLYPRNPEGGMQRNQGLDYDNLFLSCNGGGGKNVRQAATTCGCHKGNLLLGAFNPLDEQLMEEIHFRPDGNIYADDKVLNDDLTVILNLNCHFTKNVGMRKSTLRTLSTCLEAEDEDDRIEMAKLYLEVCEQSSNIPFRTAVLKYLEDFIGNN